MSKPTPGPWTVESVNSESLHDICLDYQIPGAGSPILIATVFADDHPSRPGDISNHEAEANARLMAAAPDLLAACELWDQGFTEGEQFTAEQFRVWVNKNRAAARAAIAKAKGATTAPADQPTVPLRDHLIGLSNGGHCVRCGESSHRIQSHPHLTCTPKAS